MKYLLKIFWKYDQSKSIHTDEYTFRSFDSESMALDIKDALLKMSRVRMVHLYYLSCEPTLKGVWENENNTIP